MKYLRNYGPLFELPPHNGTPTSKAAARRVAPRAPGLRDRVADFIRSRGDIGATDTEIERHLECHSNSSRPRRWELERAGVVRDSGQRRDGSIVWIYVKGPANEP